MRNDALAAHAETVLAYLKRFPRNCFTVAELKATLGLHDKAVRGALSCLVYAKRVKTTPRPEGRRGGVARDYRAA